MEVKKTIKKDGIELIREERNRQTETLKHSPARDSNYTDFELSDAAAVYSLVSSRPELHATSDKNKGTVQPTIFWPWCPSYFKPSDNPIRNLQKAGALIAAEIDRLLGEADEKTSREYLKQVEDCFEYNINHSVKVKLTDVGKAAYVAAYAKYGGEAPKLNYDDDGYCTMQLHAVMNIFGEYLFNGNNKLPIETNIKIPVPHIDEIEAYESGKTTLAL